MIAAGAGRNSLEIDWAHLHGPPTRSYTVGHRILETSVSAKKNSLYPVTLELEAALKPSHVSIIRF